MWQNGEEIWNKVWDKYMKESDSQERVRLLSALASSQEPLVLQRFVPNRDLSAFIACIAGISYL
jgi:hypothetical protein